MMTIENETKNSVLNYPTWFIWHEFEPQEQIPIDAQSMPNPRHRALE
jgi:hypothetical protein